MIVFRDHKIQRNTRVFTFVDAAGRVSYRKIKTEEFVKAIRERRIAICGLKETRWSDAKGSDIERGPGKSRYKLLFLGSPHTQYGVRIAISEDFVMPLNKSED